MNADLLPDGKVVTGHGGTGKWTRKKAFGFSRHVRSRPRRTPMRMRYDPRKSAGKGKGRNKDNHDYLARIPGQGHARMQVRREASSCDSASELLKTLTIHEEWDALGEQIYEELCAVSKGDADKSFYYSPATGWMLEDMCSDLAVYRREAAATQIQACWRGADGRAKATFVREELRQFPFSFKQFYDAHEWEVREHGHNSAWGRALALVAASKNFDAVYAAHYAEQVYDARLLLFLFNGWLSVTRIQACWRGWLGRQAAKQAKAKKERRAKRAEAKSEAKAMQLSFSERLEPASPPDKSAGQLVVGNMILGHSIANDEPLDGGKCGCVGLLTGVVPPCLGGSVTVFHGAAEAFYYVVWEYFERYLDKACDVREMHRAGSEMMYNDISSLRQLLSLGPPYKPRGNVDLQTFLAERREPLGYTKSGQRLLHHQDLIFLLVAAVFMQCDLVLLDSVTAMPQHVIVRCQRLNSRRQRSAHAQLRSDEGMVPWVRICQLVKGALGRKVLSLKITPDRAIQHGQGVGLSALGERIIAGLLARSRDDRAELKLAADELAVVETMLEFGAPVEDSVGVLQMAGDDKKPIICSDCGKVHATRATVKPRPGGLVCVSDCGLLTEGRRKRPAECSEPPPPSKKRLQLAFSDEEQPPPPSTTYKQPSTADEVHPSGEPESAAMPPPAPQCASRNESPALLVQCVSTEPSVPVPPSTLQPISDEVKDALFAKYGRIGPVASQSFASLDLPPIDDANAGIYQPPRLDVHRSAVARGPGSEPALWFKQVPPRPPSTHAAAHRLLTSLIFAVSLTDDRPRVAR